jgi:predicted ATPase
MAGGRTEAAPRVRVHRLRLTNFLSYRDATLELGDLVALVGPNASGKSNLVVAINLLRDISLVGLPAALARRGGFLPVRYRGSDRPADPALHVSFSFEGSPESFYSLQLVSVDGGRYDVKETSEIFADDGGYSFEHAAGVFSAADRWGGPGEDPINYSDHHVNVPSGHSAVTLGISEGARRVGAVLAGFQTVEIVPARVAKLQDSTPAETFEPDGSNAASIFDYLGPAGRAELVDELSAIVPAVRDVEVHRLEDMLMLTFRQEGAERGTRSFLARYMSDGTLRAFGMLLAMRQPRRPSLLVVEEPEIAIHLGALQTLVDVLRQHSESTQVLLTTHSADIVDMLDINDLRVAWNDGVSSHIANVAAHTKETVAKGLITPGELLRVDSLDPASP